MNACEISRPGHVLRRVQVVLDGQARADWWRLWGRCIMVPVLVRRRPTAKEVS